MKRLIALREIELPCPSGDYHVLGHDADGHPVMRPKKQIISPGRDLSVGDAAADRLIASGHAREGDELSDSPPKLIDRPSPSEPPGPALDTPSLHEWADAALQSLLNNYGCTSTDAGWRRLAILLAMKGGDITLPKPTRVSRTPDPTPFLIIEAAMNGSGGRLTVQEAARRESPFLNRLSGKDLSWRSWRKYFYDYKKFLAEEAYSGVQEHERPSALEAFRENLPAEIAEERANDTWAECLTSRAMGLRTIPTGRYLLQQPIAIENGVYILGLSFVSTAETQPFGPPARGKSLASVKLLVSYSRRSNADPTGFVRATTALLPDREAVAAKTFRAAGEDPLVGGFDISAHWDGFEEIACELTMIPPSRPRLKLHFKADLEKTAL